MNRDWKLGLSQHPRRIRADVCIVCMYIQYSYVCPLWNNSHERADEAQALPKMKVFSWQWKDVDINDWLHSDASEELIPHRRSNHSTAAGAVMSCLCNNAAKRRLHVSRYSRTLAVSCQNNYFRGTAKYMLKIF